MRDRRWWRLALAMRLPTEMHTIRVGLVTKNNEIYRISNIYNYRFNLIRLYPSNFTLGSILAFSSNPFLRSKQKKVIVSTRIVTNSQK